MGHGKSKPNGWVARSPKMRNLHRCHCLPKFSKYEKNNKNIPTGVQWTTPTPRTPPSVSRWLKLVDRSSSERYSALLSHFNQDLNPHFIVSDFIYCFMLERSLNSTMCLPILWALELAIALGKTC